MLLSGIISRRTGGALMPASLHMVATILPNICSQRARDDIAIFLKALNSPCLQFPPWTHQQARLGFYVNTHSARKRSQPVRAQKRAAPLPLRRLIVLSADDTSDRHTRRTNAGNVVCGRHMRRVLRYQPRFVPPDGNKPRACIMACLRIIITPKTRRTLSHTSDCAHDSANSSARPSCQHTQRRSALNSAHKHADLEGLEGTGGIGCEGRDQPQRGSTRQDERNLACAHRNKLWERLLPELLGAAHAVVAHAFGGRAFEHKASRGRSHALNPVQAACASRLCPHNRFDPLHPTCLYNLARGTRACTLDCRPTLACSGLGTGARRHARKAVGLRLAPGQRVSKYDLHQHHPWHAPTHVLDFCQDTLVIQRFCDGILPPFNMASQVAAHGERIEVDFNA